MHLSTSLTTPIQAFQANITSDTNIMIHKHNMFKIFKYWEAEGFAILMANFKSEAYWVDELSRSAWSFYLPWLPGCINRTLMTITLADVFLCLTTQADGFCYKSILCGWQVWWNWDRRSPCLRLSELDSWQPTFGWCVSWSQGYHS